MERRAKNVDVASYYPIPSDNEMCSAILLNCSQPTSKVCNIDIDKWTFIVIFVTSPHLCICHGKRGSICHTGF